MISGKITDSLNKSVIKITQKYYLKAGNISYFTHL